jgi:hypothetical protein
MRNGIAFIALILLATLTAPEGIAMESVTKIQPTLVERAKAGEVVRVLVEVRASDPAAISKDGGIPRGFCSNTDCSKLVVSQSLTAEQAPLIEPLSGQPLIVMEVTAAGLETLAELPVVVRVIDDALAEPFGSEPGGTPDLSAPQ